MAFAAQNSVEGCANISLAFGLGSVVTLSSFTFGCVEDTAGPHVEVPITLNAPLLCTFLPECPFDHRSAMDEFGVPCNSGSDSRLSLCACVGMFFHPLLSLSVITVLVLPVISFYQPGPCQPNPAWPCRLDLALPCPAPAPAQSFILSSPAQPSPATLQTSCEIIEHEERFGEFFQRLSFNVFCFHDVYFRSFCV